MHWSRAFIVFSAATGALWLSACHHDSADDPCTKLVQRQVECDFEGGAALDVAAKDALAETCRKAQKSLATRTAIDCLKAKECQTFLACRKEANEVKGLKVGF